jgi:hypothetical protein
MSNREFYGDDVKTESSWAGPARILFITLVLAGGFLYYYFGPRVEDIQGSNPRASALSRPIHVQIGADTFSIPENYTVFAKSRRGGIQDKIELYAALPNFEGYTLPRALDFEGNDSNSPVVHFSLYDPDKIAAEEGHTVEERFTEREKFERIFLPLVTNPKGEGWRYGFTRYRLSDSWGGQDEDLFVHENSDGSMMLFRCILNVPTMPSPWCRRDMFVSNTLGLSYRFKRARLDEWRDIDAGVMDLVKQFKTTPAGGLRPAPGTVSTPSQRAPGATSANPQMRPTSGASRPTTAAPQGTWARPPEAVPGAPGPDDLRPEPDDDTSEDGPSPSTGGAE